MKKSLLLVIAFFFGWCNFAGAEDVFFQSQPIGPNFLSKLYAVGNGVVTICSTETTSPSGDYALRWREATGELLRSGRSSRNPISQLVPVPTFTSKFEAWRLPCIGAPDCTITNLLLPVDTRVGPSRYGNSFVTLSQAFPLPDPPDRFVFGVGYNSCNLQAMLSTAKTVNRISTYRAQLKIGNWIYFFGYYQDPNDPALNTNGFRLDTLTGQMLNFSFPSPTYSGFPAQDALYDGTYVWVATIGTTRIIAFNPVDPNPALWTTALYAEAGVGSLRRLAQTTGGHVAVRGFLGIQRYDGLIPGPTISYPIGQFQDDTLALTADLHVYVVANDLQTVLAYDQNGSLLYSQLVCPSTEIVHLRGLERARN